MILVSVRKGESQLPITITPPQPLNAIGPGLQLDIRSDFIGPLPTGSYFALTLSTDVEGLIWVRKVNIPTTSITCTWIPWVDTDLQLFTENAWPTEASNVSVLAELRSPTATIDSGIVTRPWQSQAGLGNQISLAPQAIVTGGFTSEDRSTLNANLAAVQVKVPAIGAVGGFVVRALGELLSDLPPALLSRGPCVSVSGGGSLIRGAGAFRSDAVGIEVHFVDVPDGFGFDRGNLVEYGRRIVQLAPVLADRDGSNFYAHVVDLNRDLERHIWGTVVPDLVGYFVAPGCTVELCFLHLLP